MTEEEYGRIIAKNLKRLAFEHNKTQADICRDLGISKTTLSSWMSGHRTPKVSKIDMLAKYFGCKRSDISEPYLKELPHISEKEMKIIMAYRDALDSRREAVRALLGIED